jgi:hypothetical protein
MKTVTVIPAKKITWERIYSALGFWMYYSYDKDGNRIKTIYWCCLPFKFFRKFDLFSYKCNL